VVSGDGCSSNCQNEGVDTDGDGIMNSLDSDDDNDGVPDTTDCAPLDPAMYAEAPEVCDGLDNNCNAGRTKTIREEEVLVQLRYSEFAVQERFNARADLWIASKIFSRLRKSATALMMIATP